MTTLRTISRTIFSLSLLVFAGLPTAGCLATDIDEEALAQDVDDEEDNIAESEDALLSCTIYAEKNEVGAACPSNFVINRGTIGCIRGCTCALGASNSGSIWGTNTYTDDSNPCRAALHALGMTSGKIRVTIAAGQSSYVGSTRNGVTSSSYGSWPGSYVVSVSPYN